MAALAGWISLNSEASAGNPPPAKNAGALDKKLSGNDLPDAWLVAAVAQRGEHLVSFDRDFRTLLSRSQFTLLVGEA